MTVTQMLMVIAARWRWVLAFAAVLSAIAFAISLRLPKSYSAEIQLVVDSNSDPILGSTLPPWAADSYLNTQVDIIASRRVAERVVTQLKLDQNPVLQELWKEKTGGRGSFTVWQAEALRKKLKVTPSRESNVVTVAYTGNSPESAAGTVNAFADAYLETNLELKVDPARESASWFDERTRSLREKLSLAQKRLSAYQQSHGIVAADEKFDVENARLAELSTQLVQAQGQRAETHSRHGQAGSLETLPEVLQNGHIQGLKIEMARLEAQREQLAARVGGNHPERAKIDAEIASLKERIAAEINRIAGSLGTANRINTAREAEIQAAVDAQKQKVLKLRAERDAMAVLQREVESAQRAFDLVTQRFSQTSLESEARRTNVAVLSRATPPLDASSPRVMLNAALGLLFGGLLGAAIAILLELRQPRMRRVADWTDLLAVPVLAELPKARIPGARFGRPA